MNVSNEFKKLFPKSTWSDEEIAEAMFTPFDEEDIRKNHPANKGTLIIDMPIEEYAKKNNMIDLDDYLKQLKNKLY